MSRVGNTSSGSRLRTGMRDAPRAGWEFFETYTRDLSRRDFERLFTLETPEAYRFFGRGIDETDSGLDIDALRAVGAGINRIMRAPDKGVLLITHYQRLLDYVTPDKVHVLTQGRIVRSGGPELALELEREGYAEAAA